MYKKINIFLSFLLIFSCAKETEFNAGLEKRLTAIIDMAPEGQSHKLDFTSDENIDDCDDHDVVTITKHEDGSLDNKYYTLEIVAKDYFKSENNCNEYDWYSTEEEQVQHELTIVVYMNDLNSPVTINSSMYIDHPYQSTSQIVAHYKLIRGESGSNNEELGIEYFGHNFELEIIDLDLGQGTITGMLSGMLWRGTPVAAPWDFEGVDNLNNLDLYNPTQGDYIDDADDDGFLDFHLTDSIRIENCIFQRITVVNNS